MSTSSTEIMCRDYKDYIYSDAWRSKHPKFLKATGYRCQMFGIRVGSRNRRFKYKPYNIHHCTYDNLENERWQRDVFVLSRRAHNLIHGWLALSWKPISVTQQDKNPYNLYPNWLQKTVHLWCWLMGWILWISR
ncbi:MAG: hypothetical protein WBA93_06965 [Microcoleaceae cyanobacterium]